MSNDSNLESDGFKKVSYKRKGRTQKVNNQHANLYSSTDLPFDKETYIRRIEEAKTELLASDLQDSVIASLREGLTILNNPPITEIVCFGLGRVSESLISRYQLALLLNLRDIHENIPIQIYDPIFTNHDEIILKHFSFTILSCNPEAKYKVQDNKTTLFYLPHCPNHLSNNLVWTNWGPTLSQCIIIANSFTKIIESNTKNYLESAAEYVRSISPYVLELAVVNTFRFYEVFNDTAIHIFPLTDVNLVSENFWKLCPEPKYKGPEIEFDKFLQNGN